MTELIAIVGLPGSGKTERFRQESSLIDYSFIDDPTSSEELNYLLDAGEVQGIMLADPNLCSAQVRQALLTFVGDRATCSFLYFENDVEACRKNIIRRGDDRVESTLRALYRLSKAYEIPEDTDPCNRMPIFTSDEG